MTLETREVIDESRNYGAGPDGKAAARRIPLAIWRPAGKGARKNPLTLGELGEFLCGEHASAAALVQICWADLTALVEARYGEESATRIAALLDMRTMSTLGLAPARGEFPIVIFDTGLNASSALYFALCEYLASRGYIVIALRSFGEAPGRGLAFDAAAIETKLADASAALAAAKSLPGADAEKAAVAAWSVGGVSAALLNMRNGGVRAFVSLDSAASYAYGDDLLRGNASFAPEKAADAALIIEGAKPNDFDVPRSDFYWRELVRKGYLARIDHLNHGMFYASGGVLAFAGEESRQAEEFWSSNEDLSEIVAAFLDEALKGDANAAKLLEKPAWQYATVARK